MDVGDVVVAGAEVRRWARSLGYTVADRGRISRELVDLYRAAIVEGFRDATPAARFQARGRLLWERLHAGRSFDPTREVMAEEACRIADRLERLDRFLSGDEAEWLKLVERIPDSGRVEVVVDNALAEARHQAGQFRQLLLALGVEAAGASAAADPLDEIRARRDRKHAG